MSAGQRIADYEFLERSVPAQSNFLYVYQRGSGLLRGRVRERVRGFANRAGWIETASSPSSLLGQLTSPSLLGEVFVTAEAERFEVDDVAEVLENAAAGTLNHHVLLMVREGSALLEQPAWRQAIETIGLIEERPVAIDNYRAVTRHLLKLSDLHDVQWFGEDDKFLARMKRFVQGGRRRSLLEVGMEIDRIVLTQVEGGVLLDGEPEAAAEQREQRDLRLRLNQFLDEQSAATLYPLLELVDSLVLGGNDPQRLLCRLFSAATSIVAGKDQRYKRNREGNPAVTPYLVWGVMLLTKARQLLTANFVVALEQLGQDYHLAIADHRGWLADDKNWPQIANCLQPIDIKEPTTLDRAQKELQLALEARIAALGDEPDLQSLLPVRESLDSKSEAAGASA